MTEEIRKVSFCPHCGNRAPQKLLHVQRYMERSWIASTGKESEPAPWSTFVAVCETCNHILLYDNVGDQLKGDHFNYGDLIYPKHGLDNSVPKAIREIYEEAARIKEVAPNAFAVQIRRALEALCSDRKAKGQTLALQLKDLAIKNEIPPILAEVTDTLRLIGNIGAHGISESVHQLQAYRLDDFFRVIVEYVYVAPSKLAAFRKQLHSGNANHGADDI